MEDQGRSSVLGSLKSRKQELKSKLTLDLRVPRWEDPEIWITYRPVDHSEVRKVQQRVEKTPNKQKGEAEVDGNADLLVRYTEGVYALLDGKRYSLKPGDPEGELTTFDSDLAENLGLGEGASGRMICRALFLTDGDLIAHARDLARWSGYREETADSELEGE